MGNQWFGRAFVCGGVKLMATPDAELNVGQRPAVYPTSYPWWVWVILTCLVGVYAGWWGEEFWGWLPPFGLIGAMMALGSIGATHDWLRRALGSVDHPWRWLLVALAAYGVVGGFLVGAVYCFSTLIIVACVGRITDTPLRVAAGFFLALVVSSVGVWQTSRRRSNRDNVAK
jgi:hypothetical protein